MKNIYLLMFALAVTAGTASAQSRWSVGIQTGFVGNMAKYSGGDEQAGALFTNEPYKTMSMGVNFRYRICDHFSFQSGFDFSEFGFTYTMAQNYSLLKPDEQYAEINTSTCMSSIPAMLVFNTRLNCMSARFVTGMGMAVRGIDQKWESDHEKTITPTEGRNADETYLTEQSQSKGCTSGSILWMVGIEKVFARGNFMRFSFDGQYGLSNIAQSTVSYTENDKDYTHTFVNRGSTAAFTFAYFFNPIGTRNLKKAKP
jgi:hypothetical protein